LELGSQLTVIRHLGNFRQALQNREMFPGKSVRATGKRLKDTGHSFAAAHRHDGNRTYPENAANLWIDPVIYLSVVTPESFACAEAFTGDSRVDVELGADVGSNFTGASLANDHAIAAQGERDTVCAGHNSRRIGNGAKDGVERLAAAIKDLA
jgi:hypothetical protein